jgi:hypothetical protein
MRARTVCALRYEGTGRDGVNTEIEKPETNFEFDKMILPSSLWRCLEYTENITSLTLTFQALRNQP